MFRIPVNGNDARGYLEQVPPTTTTPRQIRKNPLLRFNDQGPIEDQVFISVSEEAAVSIEAAIAANRFGLGARPGEIAAIGSDPRGWLTAQVQGERPVPEGFRTLADSASAAKAYSDLQRARRESRAAGEDASVELRQAGARLAALQLEQAFARYSWAVTTGEAFRERLVHFWTNHFAVSVDKQSVRALAGTLENEAIRPHIADKFSVMLQAVEAHPAMIFYLDNQASVGPNSRVARRLARRERADRKGDINENLAREILELHTLGVGGGYSQADVTAFARVLTGWTVATTGEVGKFYFREGNHEPGEASILGRNYAAGGVEQGRAVLDALARHPATATHIATKLVRHFVADDPPPAAVAAIAQVFRDSDGDLPSVHRALVELAPAWQSTPVKFKTPHEFVISVLRSLDFVPNKPASITTMLKALGQRAYAPGSPAGWPDIAAAWDGPDALLDRIEWTAQIGARFGVRRQPLELAEAALGAALSERTRDAIALAADAGQGLTLLFASPDFLRR